MVHNNYLIFILVSLILILINLLHKDNTEYFTNNNNLLKKKNILIKLLDIEQDINTIKNYFNVNDNKPDIYQEIINKQFKIKIDEEKNMFRNKGKKYLNNQPKGKLKNIRSNMKNNNDIAEEQNNLKMINNPPKKNMRSNKEISEEEKEQTKKQVKKELKNKMKSAEIDIINKMRRQAGLKNIKNNFNKDLTKKKVTDVTDLKKDFFKDKCKIIYGKVPICPEGYSKSLSNKKKVIEEEEYLSPTVEIIEEEDNLKRNSIKCCPDGFKIKLGGTEVDEGAQEYLNKFSSKGTPEDEKEWNNSVKEIGMPNGFFL